MNKEQYKDAQEAIVRDCERLAREGWIEGIRCDDENAIAVYVASCKAEIVTMSAAETMQHYAITRK